MAFFVFLLFVVKGYSADCIESCSENLMGIKPGKYLIPVSTFMKEELAGVKRSDAQYLMLYIPYDDNCIKIAYVSGGYDIGFFREAQVIGAHFNGIDFHYAYPVGFDCPEHMEVVPISSGLGFHVYQTRPIPCDEGDACELQVFETEETQMAFMVDFRGLESVKLIEFLAQSRSLYYPQTLAFAEGVVLNDKRKKKYASKIAACEKGDGALGKCDAVAKHPDSCLVTPYYQALNCEALKYFREFHTQCLQGIISLYSVILDQQCSKNEYASRFLKIEYHRGVVELYVEKGIGEKLGSIAYKVSKNDTSNWVKGLLISWYWQKRKKIVRYTPDVCQFVEEHDGISGILLDDIERDLSAL